MDKPIYTPLKVNNEIELCEISDLDCKQMIEKIIDYRREQKAPFVEKKSKKK